MCICVNIYQVVCIPFKAWMHTHTDTQTTSEGKKKGKKRPRTNHHGHGCSAQFRFYFQAQGGMEAETGSKAEAAEQSRWGRKASKHGPGASCFTGSRGVKALRGLCQEKSVQMPASLSCARQMSHSPRPATDLPTRPPGATWEWSARSAPSTRGQDISPRVPTDEIM